ncbi:MAG: hypothetical protein JNK49_11600 [Planctomycetes bacterium]|nr:hypothetical protein [Planctomycetota bacterium]
MGATAVRVLGSSDVASHGLPLPQGLGPHGFPGITLWQSADVALFTMAGSAGVDRGYAVLQVGMPMGRVLATQGTRLFAQWLWFDPGNLQAHGSTAGQRFLLR